MKLKFGTGGIPITSFKNDYLNGIKRINELGLDHLEIEFVYGVKMPKTAAEVIGKIKTKYKVSLSVHAPYFINLGSNENKIFYGSIKYIADSVYIGGIAGAESVTFHPAYYKQSDKKQIFKRVLKALDKLFLLFKEERFQNHPFLKNKIKIAPETTGKQSQFGDLKELVKLSRAFKDPRLTICLDFAHMFARTNGRYNSIDQFKASLDEIDNNLGSSALKNLHIHISGINYSDKGERNHLTLLANFQEYKDFGITADWGEEIMNNLDNKKKNPKSNLKWIDVLKVLKETGIGGMLVCESPNLELDALLMKQVYDNL